MKYIVNTALLTGIVRIFFALLFAMAMFTHDVFAAEVSWEVLPDRENVTVALTREEGFAGKVTRLSPKGLLLDLGVPTAGMRQILAPDNARLFQMCEPRGRALGFFMKTDAFNYVVTRPDRNVVIISAFYDPQRALQNTSDTVAAPSGAEPATRQSAVPSSPVTGNTTRPRVAAGVDQNAADAVAQPKMEETPLPAPPPDEQSGKSGALHSQVVTASPEASAPSRLGGTEFRSRLNLKGITEWFAMHPEMLALTVPIQPDGTAQPVETDVSAAQPATTPMPEVEAPIAQPLQREAATPSAQTAQTSPAASATPLQEGTLAASGESTPVKRTYTDDKGKVIELPDPFETLAATRRDIVQAKYKDALDKLGSLQVVPDMTKEQKGDVLHMQAEALFLMHQNDFVKNYDVVVSATIAAMNYDANEPRNAVCYLRLGYINMKVDNLVEAEAYFNQLRRLYPDDEGVPLTYYYWGEYYYAHNDMHKAADQFQYIISNYSESKYARDAALGLTRAYIALGYNQEAFDIVDYIERRWPRLYMQNPSVLEIMGDTAFRLGKLDFALDKFMIYYNLVPDGPNADVILTRIGDVYARKRQVAAAKAAYQEAERRFPDRDGGLVAMMRLAEVGINDIPAIPNMFSLFQGPVTLRPVHVYTKIINEHPDSQLVPLVQLKLSMWHLWRKEYEKSLEIATNLITQHPKHELVPKAEEVAMSAFAALAAESASQNRPGRVVESWSQNAIIQRLEEELPSQSRVALAVSMWKQKDPDGALRLVSPLFLGNKIPTYSEQALQLALAIYLEHDQWQAVELLNERIGLWELTDSTKMQLDYALALAKENLGKNEEAAPLWKRLAEKGTLSTREQAYAEYFLAKNAESARQLQDAYMFGRSSLNRFLQMARENPANADTGKIMNLLLSLMDVAETSGRFEEALGYAQQYMADLPQDDPQRQGLLFRIANIYKKQGNAVDWRKMLQELVEKYPNTVHGRAAASTLRSANLSEEAARFSPNGQL